MDAASQLRAFRMKAYAMSPVFGSHVDNLIMQGVGLGDGDISISDALNSLTQGLQQAATAANLSVADYYNAQTSIAQIVAANKAGVNSAVYQPVANATGLVSSVVGNSSPTPAIFGIPVWVILGGAGLFVLLKSRGGDEIDIKHK